MSRLRRTIDSRGHPSRASSYRRTAEILRLESIFGQTNVLRREDAVGVLDSRTDAEVLQAAVLSLLYQALGESEIGREMLRYV